ncbi:MAG: FliM/FliN family flagellar motor switch protein [Planctomycetes bacterium]|nr:FliM/FliN family flagellar motor switch protein [Planctomycetota bacterium]
MSDLLSSEEIDTLLQLFREQGGESGEVAGAIAVHAGMASPGEVETYDLFAPSRMGDGELGYLDRLLAETARSLGAELARQVERPLRGECQSVESIRWATWRAEFKPPSLLFEIALDPLRGPACVEIPGALVRQLVELALGGSSNPTTTTAAPSFTRAELAVAEGIVVPVAERLAISLRTLAPLTARLLGSTVDPALLGRAPQPDDLVLAAVMRISGSGADHVIRLTLPHAELDPLLQRDLDARRGSTAGGRGRLRPVMTRSLLDAPLPMVVELGRVRSDLRSVLGLRVGDVLPTTVRVGAKLDARVGGIVKLRGTLGRAGALRALKVLELTDEDHDGS